MTRLHRTRRPDDWPSSHVRARSDLSDRLDGVLDPGEAAWLAGHLAACPACETVAGEFEDQRLAFQALREQRLDPPRDLWARTAAAIESEQVPGGFARRFAAFGRSRLQPLAILTTALAVVVIAGSLSSSQRPGGDGAARSADVAVAPTSPNPSPSAAPGATPLVVAQRVEWLSRSEDGYYQLQVANVGEVCPPEALVPCDTAAPDLNRAVAVGQDALSVYGAPQGNALIVVGSTASGSHVSVVSLPSASPPLPVPTSTAPPSPGPTTLASSSPTTAPTIGPSAVPPVATATPLEASATPTAALTPSPSVEVTASPATGSVVIASDVVLVGQSAAYSPDGGWFAFTARPADASSGPDIYLWKVGDALAAPVTMDHRSVFGSWINGQIVGSTVADPGIAPGGSSPTRQRTSSFLLFPDSGLTMALPGSDGMWRPTVDPTHRRAVYWTGSLRSTADHTYVPGDGRLVLGAWPPPVTDAGAPVALPDPTSSPTGPSPDPASAPSGSGEPATAPGSPAANPSTSAGPAPDRAETTIAAGQMEDWDARWDPSGTHLAIWIADPSNPSIGRLSLYQVDPFDGRIELQRPLLDAQISVAGFSIDQGKLVWATPGADGAAAGGRIQVLAWTDQGSGQVETVAGSVIVIR